MDGHDNLVLAGLPIPPIVFTPEVDEDAGAGGGGDGDGGELRRSSLGGADSLLKHKGERLLQHLLHPLDYIHHHQHKRRSRANSLCDELAADDDEPLRRRSLTPDPESRGKPLLQRSLTPDPDSRSKQPLQRSLTPEPPRTQAWPVYRPSVRQRARPRAGLTLSLPNDHHHNNNNNNTDSSSNNNNNRDNAPSTAPIDMPVIRVEGEGGGEGSHASSNSVHSHYGSCLSTHSAASHYHSTNSMSHHSPPSGTSPHSPPAGTSPHSPPAGISLHFPPRGRRRSLSPFRFLEKHISRSRSPAAASPGSGLTLQVPLAATLSLDHTHPPSPARSPLGPRKSYPWDSSTNLRLRPGLGVSPPPATVVRSHAHLSPPTATQDKRSDKRSLTVDLQARPDMPKGVEDDTTWDHFWSRDTDAAVKKSRVGDEGEGGGRIRESSSVERLYTIYDQIIKEGQMRRHSSDTERRRHGSGTLQPAPYVRGEMDPAHAAMLFRDSRGLPYADPFLDNISRSDLEEDESQIFVKFFKFHPTYDLIPISAKLVVFDTRLQVKKAFFALVYNGVRAAPLWDSARQQFIGMLTITDFIRILQNFYNSPNRKMEELEDHRLETWRTVLKDEARPLISIRPEESLYVAIRSLIHHKIHRLPVIDPATGNVLYIVTHKRILKFLYLYINNLPRPAVLQKSLREMDMGTYNNIETASQDTLIIEALNKFVQHRISALPIVDADGKLVDIYAKFDVINLAAEGTYSNLDVTLRKANEYRNEWFEQVHRCTLDETLGTIMERIVRAEVHRLVVVDDKDRVLGIISLSDILKELVLKPCMDMEPGSVGAATVSQMAATLGHSNSTLSKSSADGSLGEVGRPGEEEEEAEEEVREEGAKEPEEDSEGSTKSLNGNFVGMDGKADEPPLPLQPEVVPITG